MSFEGGWKGAKVSKYFRSKNISCLCQSHQKSCLCIYGDLLFGQFNQYFSQHEDLLLLLWHLSILVLYTIQRFSQLWAFSLLHCTSICYLNEILLKKVDVQSLKVSAKKTKSRNETKHRIFAYCVLCKIVLSELWISEISHFFCSLYLLSRLFLHRKTV